MIKIRFEEREKSACSMRWRPPRVQPLRPGEDPPPAVLHPDERQELETELHNVERAANAEDALKPLYDRIGLMLCQMKRHPGLPAPVPGAGGPGSCGAV